MIRGPAGDGRTAAVALDDIAEVAVAVLTDPGPHAGATYELTGPAALTMAEGAAALAAATGRPIRYHGGDGGGGVRVAGGLRRARMAGDAWVTTYTAIAAGDLEHVSGDVERLTGHQPRSLTDVLRPRPGRP